MADATRPDAVQIPHNFAKGKGLSRDAQVAMLQKAEQLLGVDKSKGEQARCRPQGGFVFASRDRGVALRFGEGHELRGKPRYEWKAQDGGILLGTLVPEARPDADETTNPE